jgi:hypothetical protein
MDSACTDSLLELERRIKELNDKFSQTLLFLSFALVVVATLKEKVNAAHHVALESVACWWSFSLFPTLVGILPLKDFARLRCLKERKEGWYSFVRWFKVAVLWFAIALIFVGAVCFFGTVRYDIFRP